jgi:hypothetical protein
MNDRPGTRPVDPNMPTIDDSKPAPVTTKRQVTRDKRRPFGSQVQKLAYEARPGYHRHWFNELPGRIDQALEAGYTHVEDREGRKVTRVVGVAPAGGPLTAFLMEIPEEWYQEDMALQAQANAEREHAIRTGSVTGQPGKDGVYIPETRGIKITTSRR